ncbi:MAG TPA: CDP-alcohol phosphatidyltransferase family protein [Spirochaetota bacterium]|nr:CDP-alcohol phosphatidyltransferase family protein [Spirochaetota bacterium]HPI88068.1 CDP-alcohol phosphatidyltransferase family protein [Spirochaetota bacterium]HPR46447.1 CDP-alcohol phosphatidyltransferase family protein [Spirochaetota bacterium]
MAKRSIIPNFVTMSNMIMGFLAIIYANRGDSESLAIAGILVFAGSFFDLTDGAIARALDVESPIGVELDSLADAVTYGIAPAIIAYYFYLNTLPEICCGFNLGMILALLFPVCAIYRLARFNVADKMNGFSGLPSPAAGIVVASVPCLVTIELPFFGQAGFTMPVEYYIPLYVIAAILMVSRVDYNKLFSDIAKKGKVASIVTLIVLIIVFLLFQMWAVFAIAFLYLITGIVRYIIKFNK